MDTITFKGPTTDEVLARVRAGQTNDAHEETSRSLKDILRANILTRFNALLLALFVVVLVVGSPVDGLFALVIVINSAIGIFQEVRAKRTLDRLAILHAPLALVLRDGELKTIPLKEVVLDDVIKLRIGEQVPADAVVLSSEGLEVDESLLTGEAESIVKNVNDKVLSGSIVVAGEGYVRAVAVGVNAYAHSITAQVKRFKIARSELIYGTNKLLTYISLIILMVAPLLIWGQIVRSGNTWQEGPLSQRVSGLCHQAMPGLSAARPMHHQQAWPENQTLGASAGVGSFASTDACASGDAGAAESTLRTSSRDYQGGYESRTIAVERPQACSHRDQTDGVELQLQKSALDNGRRDHDRKAETATGLRVKSNRQNILLAVFANSLLYLRRSLDEPRT
jgi:E1-E2 ATPase